MTKEAPQASRVALITLGCPKNEADSRSMRAQLDAAGFVVSEEAEDAHFILINTCAFIEPAIEESLDSILELAEMPRVQSGEAKLVVVGCLASRFGADLVAELPEVTAFVPLAQESEIAVLLKNLMKQRDTECAGGGTPRDGAIVPLVSNGTIAPSLGVPNGTIAPSLGVPPPAQPVSAPFAYVKISDGCSRHCSYCTIPSIRGPYQSYAFEDINKEVESLVAGGAREIILIGQDTGIWSAGEKPQNLAGLLDCLALNYPETWFRVMYLQPEGISDELLAVMGAHENIARYLDIPLQHANKEILTAMNRRGCGKEYLELVNHIREALPGVVLRTTMIVGFPGERQEDFEELSAFVEAARFDYVGIFAYSCEEGTKAAELPHRIDEETAQARLQELRDRADHLGFELAQKQQGHLVDVLICGQDEEGIYGRTKGQAPDVDGVTYVIPTENEGSRGFLPSKPEPGTVVSAVITEAVLYDLFAETTAEAE